MRRTALAGLALAFTIGGAGALDAQQAPDTRRPRAEREIRARRGPGTPDRMLLRGIELNDTQKEQIKAIFEKRRPSPEERAKMRERGRELRERAREQRAEGTTRDTAALRQRREQTIQRMQQQRAELHREIRAVLTPEQQRQFDRNVDELNKWMEERMKQRRENHRDNR